MNYSKINKCSVAESPGISVVLFVSGCLPNKCKEGNCPGCHNKEAQKFTHGEEFTFETKCELITAINKPYINSFVLCGGEIFDQDVNVLVDLVQTVKELMPNKSI
jgi:anaerobic ribonucleoside-triphosphate reductase activating protein